MTSDNSSSCVLFHSSESDDDATHLSKRQRHHYDTSSSSSKFDRVFQFHYDDISFSWICEYCDEFDLIIVSSLNKTFNKLQHSSSVTNWRHLPPLRISHTHHVRSNYSIISETNSKVGWNKKFN